MKISKRNRPSSERQLAISDLALNTGICQVIGTSPAIRSQIEHIPGYAASDAPLLICGESGTGKEVFAKAIHYSGPRAKHPFVPLNCAALPLDLLENELFGHVSGTYTGAGPTQKAAPTSASSVPVIGISLPRSVPELFGRISITV